jgi:hypothetical protein
MLVDSTTLLDIASLTIDPERLSALCQVRYDARNDSSKHSNDPRRSKVMPRIRNLSTAITRWRNPLAMKDISSGPRRWCDHYRPVRSWTSWPSTKVRSTCVSRISSVAHAMMSRSRTNKFARLPISILPSSSARSDACAALIV